MTSNLPSAEDVPIRTQLLENLTKQSSNLSKLFTLLPSPPSSSPNLSTSTFTATYTSLLENTTELAGLVKSATEHQIAYEALMSKRKEVEGLERKVRGLVRDLEEGRRGLEMLVMEGREGLKSLETSQKSPVQGPNLISHAISLSKHTSQPISNLMESADKAQYQPWPTEAGMRMGLLFQLQGSMSGIGDVGKIGDEINTVVPQPQVEQLDIPHHEEPSRRYDPNAVFALDLNSDDSDDD